MVLALLTSSVGAQDVPVPEVPFPSDVDLRQVQDEHDSETRFCFIRERSLHPRARGVLVVQMGLDAAGRAVGPVVRSSTFEPGGVVADCLVAAVARWTFPRPRDLAASFTLTFTLGTEPAEIPALAPPPPPDRRASVRVEWQITDYWGTDEQGPYEIQRGIERRRDALTACIAEIAAAHGAPADVVLDIESFHPGRLRRDDMTVLSSSWPRPDEALRCLYRELERVDVREMPTRTRVRWVLSVR